MPEVRIEATDGSGAFAAYISLPPETAAPRPGIICMQQIFGVNPEMRGFADDFVAHGYVAICPDLFWRQEPGVQIVPGSPGAFDRAVRYGRGFDADKGVEDLKATLAFVRGHPSCNGKVGTVGYCLGGLMAYLMAARSDAACSVGYFGVGIEQRIEEAASLAQPLMLHIPERTATSRARRRRSCAGRSGSRCSPYLSGGRPRLQPRRRGQLRRRGHSARLRPDRRVLAAPSLRLKSPLRATAPRGSGSWRCGDAGDVAGRPFRSQGG